MQNSAISNQKNKNRNTNIDFIRIIGMFAIIITHLINHGKPFIKFHKYKSEIILLNIFCMWHVSSFGIISGLVGSKTPKFYNLLYLWITVLFYTLLFYITFKKKTTNIFVNSFEKIFYPVIQNKYWYFSSYFGIYPFLSSINIGISSLTRINSQKCIYFMIGIFFIWNSYYNFDSFSLNKGYSPFSLLIFYTLGVYIEKYIFYIQIKKIYRIIISISCFIIFILISLSCFYINIKNSFPKLSERKKNFFRVGIISFPMIVQVFTLIIFIAQIKFNKVLSRIISIFAPLTFDIYLIHENPFIRNNYVKNSFKFLPNNLNLSYIHALIIKKGIVIFFFCFFISYIRNIIFRTLKIKELCIHFENIIIIINYF